ncbi:Na/Pi cotransporter family protein [Streptococcus oralis]|uniref:Sodium-dependent phosphate transporter n=4 Tax=Bacteria TaxID=2 RepID=A0A1S0Z6W4_SALET|nr:Na/Pi cotransporter family protein [Streptococcus oralis]ATF56096.1 Na/Pi cotransporter family protein [Streptococcus oralis]MBA1350643.1 Na/Pi cotransporter family protein [Streptococcus oralis subsp. oralis]MBS9407431.1 Na/Pi cotransporter family protein [Streptococcus oralis]MBT3115631.1 Na/Pi cotransporter family protein [Streptococcus oralis]MCP8923731.1 Na/Pi cotransporter family protein [Streptococcus oralis]
MSINWQEILFHFLGGLGLFLYSIKTMGDGLQQAAGDRLRFYIDKYTSNPFLGVLVGIVVTALIQSSTGVTVITVGLVSASLLTLRQAIGIIMGANIGTTVTSFIIGFKLGEYALPLIFLGTMFLFFTKNRTANNIGRILFGVGGIFYALNLISAGMSPLKDLPQFKEYMVTLGQNPILGVVAGAVITVLIQASSATIGILQGLYAGGFLDLKGSLPVLFGDNIGTTLTVIIAAAGANVSAKRVAATHVTFNVLGTILCLILLGPFTAMIEYFQALLHLSPEMTIAFSHGAFNVSNTIVQFPFIGALAYFVTKLIPGEDEVVKYEPLYLDEQLIQQSPSIALGNAKKELLHLGNYATKAFDLSYTYIIGLDEKVAEKGHKTEEAINTIDEKLTRYLIRLSSESLSQKESEVLTNILDSSRDLERIGDHAEGLLNLTDYLQRKNVQFSDAALEELAEIYQATTAFIKDALDSVENNDIEKAQSLIERHKEINNMERVLRKTHIKRLNKGECSTQAGVNFIDIISHYTRVSDHAMNLAEKVIAEQI